MQQLLCDAVLGRLQDAQGGAAPAGAACSAAEAAHAQGFTIRYACCAHWVGRCTYTQLARLYVLMYPRQPSSAAVGRAVDAVWKEDLARQGTVAEAMQ
uniref:Uncharacterized protein n=1 Tax=Tetradesmus obliquus TaxID=3088 RepID=A0A383VUT6_TETOB|eukprot:jgi/Sobl393_1/14496/SZX68166.1